VSYRCNLGRFSDIIGMHDPTPSDIDRHIAKHAQNMVALNSEMQCAIISGNIHSVNAVVRKHQITMNVQERLTRLSNSLTNAAVEATAQPQLAMHSIVESAVSPVTSRGARNGNYLAVKDFIFPIWEAISHQSGSFTIDDLRRYVREHFHLRPADLQRMSGGLPRWLINTRIAFKDHVYSNHADWKSGKASEKTVYMTNMSPNGQEGLYVLNDVGQSKLQSIVASRSRLLEVQASQSRPTQNAVAS